jgi:hypothetical protein
MTDDWFVEPPKTKSWQQDWFQKWTDRADREIYGTDWGMLLKQHYVEPIREQLMGRSPLLDMIGQQVRIPVAKSDCEPDAPVRQ